jgi:isoaspartyl peptidase/L-asparaginase-like protein (Ntn-hydrolase superfamily)
MRQGDDERIPPAWRAFDLRRYWNFQRPYDELFAHDTVGAVAVAGDGAFAVAGSTGGSVPMLRGRVGDTPLVGCGFYAGPAGAVAATGIGEEIVRRMLSRDVYEAMARGASPQDACEEGIARFQAGVPVGLIAVAGDGHGVAANVPMAHAVMVG